MRLAIVKSRTALFVAICHTSGWELPRRRMVRLASSVDALEVIVDETSYLVPMSRVVEVALRVSIEPAAELHPPVLGFVRFRGQPVPAIDLRRCLGHPPRPPKLSDRFVLVRVRDRIVALIVDETCGLRSVSELRGVPVSATHLAGAALTDEGITYLAELDAALSLEDEKRIDAALAAEDR